ncbi:MAG: 50S ribosomal protein L18Ae [Methanomassiliicoccales archaeon]|jgi:large subunit ribosomal protein LX
MKAFRVVGSFKIRKRLWQDFNVEIAAEDKDGATEKVLSNFGSHHRVNRRNISIKEISLLEAEDVSDPVVKHLIGGT